MGKLLNIIPISDLRQDAAKVLKRVRDAGEPHCDYVAQSMAANKEKPHRRDAEGAEIRRENH